MLNKIFNNDNNQSPMRQKAQKTVDKFQIKYIRSRALFLFLNLSLIIMSAFMSILSAYSIAKNQYLPSVWVFIVIAFLTSIIAFLNTMLSTFSLTNAYNTAANKIEILEQQAEDLKDDKVENMRDFLTETSSLDIIIE
ncbi:hypothetical protein ACW95P_00555 [Candidatus Mycoplasma pogonae]